MRKTMRYLVSALAVLLCVASFNRAEAQKVLKPKVKGHSAFIIFTDSRTFENCSKEILDYKNILETENLATYVVYDNWDAPEPVKAQIERIAAKSKVPVEGMVFVGNIPIVRVRGGQHLTTAFKMDEIAYPMTESSVTSDRFYDTPTLKFRFIAKDSANANQFYYLLTDEGAQRIAPAYYSARILVPKQLVSDTGKDEYTLMRAYLAKVVNAHKEQNQLDKYIYFAGNGYNSDCLTQWRQQKLVFSSYFEDANGTFLNFRMNPVMKKRLFTYMQDPTTDIFLFYEHGSPDKQHINENATATGLEESLVNLLRASRSYLRYFKGEEQEAVRKEMCKHFNLDEKVLSAEVLEQTKAEDKEFGNNKDMLLSDLVKLKTGSRITIFNACYNGSFHKEGYVAGYHLFNDGQTVVTQGNTVNVLQDKWGEQLIGMLTLGARVGFWQKEVATLESHLCGDPTFAFTPTEKDREVLSGSRLNNALAKDKGAEFWKNELLSNNPNLRTLAIKRLTNIALDKYTAEQKLEFANMLANIYNSDANMTVRTQALYDISYMDSPLFRNLLQKSLYDYSELISRFSAHWAGKTGDTTLIPALLDLNTNAPQLLRVKYATEIALRSFSVDVADNAPMVKAKTYIGEVSIPHYTYNTEKQRIAKDDKRMKMKLRALRNQQGYPYWRELLSYITDKELPDSLKLIICEAFGWMNYQTDKPAIIDSLKQLKETAGLSGEVVGEINKSIKRLQWQ